MKQQIIRKINLCLLSRK